MKKRPEANWTFRPVCLPSGDAIMRCRSFIPRSNKAQKAGLTETNRYLPCFALRYEYVLTLTITALHERIRSLHVDHIGSKEDPECSLSRSLADQSLFGRFKPVGFGNTACTICTGAELSRSQI